MVQVAPGLQMVHRGGVIGPIDRAAIRARNQMPARVDRDLDAAMPELFLHVDDALALLQKQRGEGVAPIPHEE